MTNQEHDINHAAVTVLFKRKGFFHCLTPVLLLVSFVFFLLCIFISSCHSKSESVEFQPNECRRQPAFIRSVGFDPSRAAFSTSEKKIPGLVLLELSAAGDTTGKKIYQNPGWRQAGWLGPIQIDAFGNCFTAPVPVINTTDNPPEKKNTVYIVDNATGEMKAFCSLPLTENATSENPYGILGFTYLCEAGVLYVSTVSGSVRANIAGRIYAINATTGNILDSIIKTDAIGMGISYTGEQRRLYFGNARSPEVSSVLISAEGKFSGKPEPAFSIAGLGPRGDDKVRRIKFDRKTGEMQVVGIEFNFNLTAPTEKQETVYIFRWDENQHKWINNNTG